MVPSSVLDTEDTIADNPFYSNGRRQAIKGISKCASLKISMNDWVSISDDQGGLRTGDFKLRSD